MKAADFDILVFPEFGWVPFDDLLTSIDLANPNDINAVMDKCFKFSEEIGKAVLVNSIDSYNTIYSVFANAAANEDETGTSILVFRSEM